MGRIFTVGAENLTISTGKPLFVITPAASGAGSLIAIHRLEIGQSGTTTSAMIRAALSTRTGSTVATTSGLTPRNLSPIGGPISGIVAGTAAAAGTVGAPVTTDTTPAYTDFYYFNFNNLNGLLYIPTPQEITEIPASTVMVFRTLADPATLTGWTWTLTYEELT